MGFRRAAVVMAGGSGTRFWPVSTPEKPKQFLRLASAHQTLLEQSVGRIQPLVGEDLFIATTPELLDATKALLPKISPNRILVEPAKRNTLGALVWATAQLMCKYGQMSRHLSIAVLTADHMISPDDDFRDTATKAFKLAEENDALVTIGVPTTRPATEYGYIEKGAELGPGAWYASRFIEKPAEATAIDLVANGNCLWNSGMFFWTINSFIRELKGTQPAAFDIIKDIVSAVTSDNDAAAKKRFEDVEATSIDYGVMERAANVVVVSADFKWDDLGSWDALIRGQEGDSDGNVGRGNCRLVETHGSVVLNESAGLRVNVLGADDLIVVVTDQEVLVCPKSKAQDVRKLAD